MVKDSIRIKTPTGEVEIVMTFARLNNIARVVGDVGLLGSVLIDPVTQIEFMKTLVEEQKSDGFSSDKPLLDVNLLTIESAKELLRWGCEHLTDFFTGQLTQAIEIREKFSNLTAVSSEASTDGQTE